MLDRLAWALIHSPTELWVKIFKCKYFKNCHPLHARKSLDYSWLWKGIDVGLDIIRKNSIWKVKNGYSIHAFTDNWISDASSPLFHCYPNPNMPVSDFIDPHTRTWNIDLINSFFTLDNAQKIANIRIPLTGDDGLVCLYTKNGEFSVKTCYKALSGEINYLQNPHPSQPTYKALRSFPTLPKIHLFLWKCIKNVLPTGVRLSQYRNQDLTETSIRTWFDEWLKISHGIAIKQSIFVTAWCIWRDRCFKTFQNQTLTPLSTANHALKLLADIDACMPEPIVPLDISIVPIQSPDNSGLPEHCRILYCDASYDSDTNEAGSDLVLTDLTGSFE
ncbi:uncharacterized protein LOC113306023 [Papaver somniferum]|uniref:uncharacterized protein LOC113306023 n=1 Tax=Papaver somniferum TaxID=3469 RepID=UPI000E705ABB|nr:uncharacterized protein LOC113306023 [Papaver somniferum]